MEFSETKMKTEESFLSNSTESPLGKVENLFEANGEKNETFKDTENKIEGNVLVKEEQDVPDLQVEVREQSNETTSEIAKVSKKQLKRLAKKALWESTKKERRAIEKEKRKKRKINNPALDSTCQLRKKLKNNPMEKSSCKVGVVIDMSLDDYMTDKSIASCVKQILRCYSINRRAENPVQFHISSLSGRNKAEMSKHNGFMNWDVNFHETHFTELFDKDKIVYLTAESDNVIEKFEDDTFYVIGGLVDHNAHKGLCHNLANEKGLKHARLPIDKYICLKTRKVLTIDHVFNIITNVCNGQNWKDAFLAILPARKGAKELPSECSEEEGADFDE